MKLYTTVKTVGQIEIVEKRSRFLGYVSPAKTEADALSFLSAIRKKHSDANHNVYAYNLRENNTARFSDDGEPSGTAGLPVLDVLKKEGVTDVVAVITRYFGGTLLGTGGLVHAYSAAAKEALHAARKAEMVLCREITAAYAYPLHSKVLSCTEPALSRDVEYADNVTMTLFVPADEAEAAVSGITEATYGQAAVTASDTEIYIERIGTT